MAASVSPTNSNCPKWRAVAGSYVTSSPDMDSPTRSTSGSTAVWGSGDRAFHGRQVRMRLIATTGLRLGVVLLAYRPIPNAKASATT